MKRNYPHGWWILPSMGVGIFALCSSIASILSALNMGGDAFNVLVLFIVFVLLLMSALMWRKPK